MYLLNIDDFLTINIEPRRSERPLHHPRQQIEYRLPALISSPADYPTAGRRHSLTGSRRTTSSTGSPTTPARSTSATSTCANKAATTDSDHHNTTNKPYLPAATRRLRHQSSIVTRRLDATCPGRSLPYQVALRHPPRLNAHPARQAAGSRPAWLENVRELMCVRVVTAASLRDDDLVPARDLPDPVDRNVLAARSRSIRGHRHLRRPRLPSPRAYCNVAQHPDAFISHLLDLDGVVVVSEVCRQRPAPENLAIAPDASGTDSSASGSSDSFRYQGS